MLHDQVFGLILAWTCDVTNCDSDLVITSLNSISNVICKLVKQVLYSTGLLELGNSNSTTTSTLRPWSFSSKNLASFYHGLDNSSRNIDHLVDVCGTLVEVFGIKLTSTSSFSAFLCFYKTSNLESSTTHFFILPAKSKMYTFLALWSLWTCHPYKLPTNPLFGSWRLCSPSFGVLH